MEQAFLRELIFLVCFALVGYQVKADSSTFAQSKPAIELVYKNFISSGKLKADIYGLTAVLMDMQEVDVATYDAVIKYFIAHGCDINEKLDIKYFATEYSLKYNYLTGRYINMSQEDIQNLIQSAEKDLNSNILTKLFCCFNHRILLLASGAPSNPYMIQALINNDAQVNNLGGILNFVRYSKDYEMLTDGTMCSCCIGEKYPEMALNVAKHIYKKNSYINRAIMYVLMSKSMYKKINE